MQHAAAAGERRRRGAGAALRCRRRPRAWRRTTPNVAGDRALAVSALDRARAHYRAALAALERGRAGGDRRAALGRHRAAPGDGVHVRSRAQPDRRCPSAPWQLAERHGDAPRVARARHWLGCVNYALGEPRAAIAHGERALSQAEQAGDEPLAVQVDGLAGRGACRGRPVRARRRTARSGHRRQAQPPQRRGTPTSAWRTRWCAVACVLGDRGQFAAAAQMFRPSAGMRRRC